ncbi:MAG: ATP-binding cassette domain-containing protein, partial [Clostridia bacterium]|nr:ATP-binding cassette domain-containing protein [Clostridia bacterium]
MDQPLIEVKSLQMYFPVGNNIFGRRKQLKAVDGVSFDLYPAETFGLVGESGCGKTTVGRALVRLYRPTGGRIIYRGTDITDLDEKAVQPYRSKMQMIFQDPYASLNPRMTVPSIIAEPMALQQVPQADIDARVRELVA